VDTLITAVAAIAVNDIWKPYIRSDAPDSYYLKVARWTSIVVTLVGVALVPVFSQFDSIFSAHGAFTAAVSPPLVIALLLAILWPRFTSAAASATIIGGFALILLSIQFPGMIDPFAHGVPTTAADGTELVGAKAHKFMRAFFGLAVSLAIGVIVSFFTKPRRPEDIDGLTQATSQSLVRRIHGPNTNVYDVQPKCESQITTELEDHQDPLSGDFLIQLSPEAQRLLDAQAGTHVLLSDLRWWFGGLRSCHATVSHETLNSEGVMVSLGPHLSSRVDARKTGHVIVERLL
jgi:hypothetical protein